MMLARLAGAAVLVLVASASGALADGRVALVIGNSTYAHAGRLPNAENDATDMAAALRRLGFEVTTELDTDRGELTEALRDFTDQSAGADVAVVFYSGHGMEMDGVNYLVPVDARLARDMQVRYETVTLADVLASTEGASLRVVILDACRDNPLARSMQRTVANRSISRGSLGELDDSSLGNETLVAYAATAGTTAADGRGRNSPYTSALLSHLDEPLEILTLFRRVRAEVLEATGGQQRPHEYQSLLVEHYLGGAPPPPTAEAENLFWQTIAESEDPADFEDYLRQFPDGTFARLARRRMEALADVADVVAPRDVAQLDVARLRQIAGEPPALDPAPAAAAETQDTGLLIVAIEGENSINIIERGTAVPTLVEVRDRNDPAAETQDAGLYIVVIEGEDNPTIEPGMAVPTLVEVRDRNDLPVSGALVMFLLREVGTATLNAGLQRVVLTTNALGQAAVTVNPVASGAVELSVSATFQGQAAAIVLRIL